AGFEVGTREIHQRVAAQFGGETDGGVEGFGGQFDHPWPLGAGEGDGGGGGQAGHAQVGGEVVVLGEEGAGLLQSGLGLVQSAEVLQGLRVVDQRGDPLLHGVGGQGGQGLAVAGEGGVMVAEFVEHGGGVDQGTGADARGAGAGGLLEQAQGLGRVAGPVGGGASLEQV